MGSKTDLVVALFVAAASAACGDSSDATSTTAQYALGSAGSGGPGSASAGSAGSGSGSTASETNCMEPIAGIGSGTSYRACAAGVSTELGPGVPADFHGTNAVNMPLSAEEQAAVEAARALASARAPAGEDPVNVGFPKVTP